MNATATYRKTQTGKWVVQGPASLVRPNATVTVTKKDGSTKVEMIDSVGKIFSLSGIDYRYGYILDIRSDNLPSSMRSATCDECGRPSRRRVEAFDSSGLSGMVCTRCASYSQMERSFA